MGMTITEKILFKHAGKEEIHPGDFIMPDIDFCLANDITGPLAIEQFEKIGAKKVFNREKIALIPDHFTPAKDVKSANQCKVLKDFAEHQAIKHYYEVGRCGIEHAFLPERGMILPGELVVGADSHTCTYGALGAFATGVGSTDLAAAMISGKVWLKVPETIKFAYRGRLRKWVGGKDIILFTIADIGVNGALYKAMEFSGNTIEGLGIDDRFTICNMAIEAGAKSGIIEPDETAFGYINEVNSRSFDFAQDRQSIIHRQKPRTMDYGLWTKLKSDEDATYCEVKEYDLSNLEPQVSCPHIPSNVKPVSQLRDIKIDQAVIGSCTNGRISDIRIAAQLLKGKKVYPGLRLIVIPATPHIYQQALKEGLVEIFIQAGGVITPPTCGPCLGGHMGILAEGERAISTTNRNFRGRMGHLDSEVYLSNPAVAAASAIRGKISHPDEVM
ncbi:MAG: 3-isopropylmalate dehydratase large subunit [Candidatus Omnitrophota bacterium]|nr:3-isopropylmalate dehydratase large subunit [Candidatus Omnitrophota bacterium]